MVTDVAALCVALMRPAHQHDAEFAGVRCGVLALGILAACRLGDLRMPPSTTMEIQEAARCSAGEYGPGHALLPHAAACGDHMSNTPTAGPPPTWLIGNLATIIRLGYPKALQQWGAEFGPVFKVLPAVTAAATLMFGRRCQCCRSMNKSALPPG